MTTPINGWRTFVLTINSSSEKLRETMGWLGHAGILAEPFIGLDASISGINGTKWTYEVDHPGSNYHISNKHINMDLSWLMILKTMSYLPGDAFVILEDDVRFEADWKTHLDVALTHLPSDWDLLYLGNCCCQNRPDNQAVWGRLYRVKYSLCTHALAVRAKALPLLVNRLEKIWAAIDIALAIDCMPHLNCYAILPRVANQFQTDLPL